MMRSGMCLLTTCGIVGLALSGVFAEENQTRGTSAATQQVQSTSERTSQYFSGGARPKAGTASTRTLANFPPVYAEGEKTAFPSKPRTDVKNYHEELFGTSAPSTSSKSGVEQAGHTTTGLPAWADKKGGTQKGSSGVVQADFSQSNKSRNAGIRQVSGTEEAGNPFRITSQQTPVINTVPATSEPLVTEQTGQKILTGPQTPSVTLEWVKRSDINVGQECSCDLIVKNSGKSLAQDLVVEAYFPKTVRLTNADPKPSKAVSFLSWDFSTLAPGEEKVIHLSMIPSTRGDLSTHAAVRFTGTASSVFKVEEPLLKIAMTGPNEVMVGDPASQIITVTNPGTGVAHNVKIEAIIPKGLEHTRGERLVMEIGALNPNESRKLRLALAAADGGKHAVSVTATADGNLRQVSSTEVFVIAPSLKVAIKGPGLRYKGRTAEYLLSVSNDGAATSNNVRVMHKVPEGFKFVKADRGGQFDWSTKIVSWFVGRLEPGQKTEIKVELEATGLGDYVHHVGAVSEHGARSEAQAKTSIEGTASLVLEIVDLDDPVEVGTETAYEIRVRNDGSKSAQNVGISCEMPAGIELITAKGPVDHIAENGLLVFKSLPTLEPGKTALFRVHVKGIIGGNQRFRARLASDSIQEPLIFEELTKFYKD